MSYCINPNCPNPTHLSNTSAQDVCESCGSPLLLKGRYRVVQPLGSGGFGTTYEVDDRGTLKVLKVLNLDAFYDEPDKQKVIELFQREARVLQEIRHSGLPKVGVGGYFTYFPKESEDPLHCLVMEKIDGLNLEEWLTQQGNKPISQSQAIAWLKQLVTIVQTLHTQHYLHRDIKPANIMLRSNGELVLIDLGAVREITETYLNRQRGTGVISPGFTPREQTEGKAMPQSDFFALGRTFVYLLTGKFPKDLPENPRTGKLIWDNIAPEISKPLVALIDYMMDPFPGKRPKNTQEILQCLTEIEQNSQLSQLPVSIPTRPKLPPQSAETLMQSPEHHLITTPPHEKLSLSQQEKRNQRIKQGVFGLLSTYGLAVAFNSKITHFMWFFNQTLTWAGSLLLWGFGFGSFMVCLGAIFFPFVTCAILTLYFFIKQQRYASAFTLFWTSLSLFDAAGIIKGTRVLDFSIEDQDARLYILDQLGWYKQIALIGGLLHFFAFLILLVSIAVGFLLVRNPQRFKAGKH